MSAKLAYDLGVRVNHAVDLEGGGLVADRDVLPVALLEPPGRPRWGPDAGPVLDLFDGRCGFADLRAGEVTEQRPHSPNPFAVESAARARMAAVMAAWVASEPSL